MLAFNQLRDNATLAEQLDRLPATTAGLVDIFKNMNTQLSEIAGSKNTDVLAPAQCRAQSGGELWQPHCGYGGTGGREYRQSR